MTEKTVVELDAWCEAQGIESCRDRWQSRAERAEQRVKELEHTIEGFKKVRGHWRARAERAEERVRELLGGRPPVQPPLAPIKQRGKITGFDYSGA